MNDFKVQIPAQSPTGSLSGHRRQQPSPAGSFGRILTDSLDKVNRLQLEADANVQELVTGEQTDIHQTMISLEKASVSFELLMQIRNKLLAAYEKIMRTQV
jgi:flagellar hook-basal body complex protein FliE